MRSRLAAGTRRRAILRLVGVEKVLDGRKVLDGIHLDIQGAAITAIIASAPQGRA